MQRKLFDLSAPYKPTGDQPQAIRALADGLLRGERNQVLLGVTGSGKTFTMANVIAKANRPALIMAPNKILAAQLYTEMKGFFPGNHVEYFVSYYDYYQPEAYVPATDTYIDKDASVNEQLDRMRHSATRSMLEEEDTIVVGSVSAIYGLGSPEEYGEMKIIFWPGQNITISNAVKKIAELQYKRNDMDFNRGDFRVRGDNLDVFPSHATDTGYRISFSDDTVESIFEFDALTGEKRQKLSRAAVYPNTHYATPMKTLVSAVSEIRADLKERLAWFKDNMKLVEEQRLAERTNFDLEMIEATGICRGIENYSRYLSGRLPGRPPPTLMEYLPKNAILFVDESHITVPQIGAMYVGDRARKTILSEHGFRLPSALDNRPLKFEEWDALRPQTIFVSATPNDWEIDQSGGVVVDQVIRPTGLLDPLCEIRPAENQVENLVSEIRKVTGRVLVTTLTKKTAEHLTDYLLEAGVKAKYMHSDIETLGRIDILRELRLGKFQVLVGINLLREGLDIPECELVMITDADKQGFLRSARSLIQTIGRAARNADGRVILYADETTAAMNAALSETARRREKQTLWNAANGITPESIQKSVFSELTDDGPVKSNGKKKYLYGKDGIKDADDLRKEIRELTRAMKQAAHDLDFEKAAKLRDEVHALENDLLLIE
ncbi:MAG: excinuclease ABC subunit UvrB [Rickettsiales bacterium]|jgi:excinuclease ABC subunit B|nr:excinuclease ABC subunit UvrB [Rickettsiales bacterium]